jgi:hypothetical protein
MSQYVIKDTANGYDYYYQKNHSKVIIFDTMPEAFKFIEDFYNFATMQAQAIVFFGDEGIIDDIRRHRPLTTVEEIPENFNRETINFRDMR